MLRAPRYLDTPPTLTVASGRLYTQRARDPRAPAARRVYAFICAEADAGRLVGVEDVARAFDTTERTAYRWIAELTADLGRAR